MSHRRALVVLVFLAGCVTGGVSAQLAAPLVHAQGAAAPTAATSSATGTDGATGIQRWEHYCEQLTPGGGKVAGERGWELVAVYSQVQSASESGSYDMGRIQGQSTYYAIPMACYKRPIAAAKP
jgi:hypothetical protein